VSKLKKLASDTALYGLSYFGGRLLNFLLTPYYTRYFTDQADYGVMTLIYAYITFLIIIFTYGLETGYFFFTNQKDANAKKVSDTAFSAHFISAIFFSILIILFSGNIKSLLPDYGNTQEFIVLAALILLFDTITTIPFAQLRKNNRPIRFAFLKFINILLNIAFNIFFLEIVPIIFKADTKSLGVGFVFISNVLSSLIMLWFLRKELKSFNFKIDLEVLKKLLKYSLPLLVLGLAGMINETIGRVMLDFRLPLDESERLKQIGIYSACFKLSIFMTLSIQAFRYAAEPFFFRELQKPEGKILYGKGFSWYVAILSFIFLVLSVWIDAIILVIGESYREAINTVPILIAANGFLGVFYYLSQWYKQTQKNMMGAWVSVFGAVLTILINYIFIPTYGYIASAWANFICYFAIAIVSLILGHKYWGFNFNTKKILVLLFSVIILYAAYVSIKSNVGILIEYLVKILLPILYLLLIMKLFKVSFKSLLDSRFITKK
jgi:O-antigen/teichoic acid export membrane protein